LDQTHPTMSADILTRLGSGDVRPKPAIARRDGTRVHFSDGSTEVVDAIIYATGYRVSFPFFEPSVIVAKDNDLPLYLRVFPMDREDLAFVGLAQPVGAVMPLAEAQAKLIAALYSGEYDLPERAQRKQRTERERARMFARYVPSRRHTMQLDFDEYMAQLKTEVQAGRTRARHRQGRAGTAPEAARS